MATATKKSPAYDKGYREGKADKAKKPAPMMESPEGEEEEEEEEMDAAKGRKRDGGYMKTPMDATCTCGAKGRKGKKCSCGAGKKDGMCGSRKMDSLTAPEYLDACELGINRRSNSYIRARLDAEQRLDLKCGNGAISPGQKCTKGAASAAPSGNAPYERRPSIRRGIATGAKYGALIQGTLSAASGAVLGAQEGGGVKGALATGLVAGVMGAGVGAIEGGAIGGGVNAIRKIGYKSRRRSRARSYGDNMWAKGFEP